MNMMTSLFSSFDPMGGLSILNYTSLGLIIVSPIIMESMFTKMSRNKKMNTNLYDSVLGEMSSAMTNKYKSGKMHILMTLFFMILIMNMVGLTPYIFTSSAHMMTTLSMALPFWLGFMIFGLVKNTNHFFSHLVPLSTPLPLSQFMVIIESVSQIIRPITLSVRLAANMTAGHILMGLASGNITMLNMSSLILIILLILETAVAFIQSYVFTILLSMYMNEA